MEYGPLLFNIALIKLFYECEDSNIANYGDDTTPYACGENVRVVLISSVEEKLLGITTNYELKFEKLITGICNKASHKK